MLDKMTQTTDKLQSLLESVLRRLDANQKAADERHQVQVAYNDQFSNELKHLAKQIDLMQEDVDEVRKSPSPPNPAAAGNPGTFAPGTTTTAGSSNQASPLLAPTIRPPPPPPLYTDGATQPPFARLVNHGPPLLQNSPLAYEQHQGVEHYVKPPRQDFPRFDGDAPCIWLERCTSYFELYWVPHHNWVTTAGLYMDGLAAMWLRVYRQTHPAISWPAFRSALEAEFGPEEFKAQMYHLVQLCQTGSVQEYRQQFETSMYHLRSLDPTLRTHFFISQFLLVLKDEF
ncbi:hypothetical protein ZWY2020_034504 [Hordeum vulgare]|nr:hypothetical protein ZWY2020_034504 [Hordeum vulgare]